MDGSIDRRLMLAGAGLAGVAGVAALTRAARGGPIDPPAGPIGPTGKTLQQIYDRVAKGGERAAAEPRRAVQDLPSSADAQFVIDQPGAYYLSGDVTGEPGKVCIDIRCSDVDLDGGGFTFHGAQGTSSCIRCSPPAGLPQSNVEVYDCAFSGWQGCPCDMSACRGCFVSDCAFSRCNCPDDPATGEHGAMCRCGPGSEVCECDVRNCVGSVVSVGDGSTIECCTCVGGSGGGYLCGSSCSCDDCSVTQCDGFGIQCGASCSVEDCDVRECTGLAISVGDSSTVECCACVSGGGGPGGGGGGGILMASRCVCDDCSVVGDGVGIQCGDGCVVSRCTCQQCFGIDCQGQCTIYDNECIECGGSSAGGAIVVHGGRCCLESNYCSGGGILVLIGGDAALIEDNHCVGSSAGTPGAGGGVIFIEPGVQRCHIVNNRVRNHSLTGMVLGAANSFGPIVVVAGGGDLAAYPGASHPWANFLY